MKLQLLDAACWLYNPLAINICTRGSAESFVVLLPVLSSLAIALYVSRTNRHRLDHSHGRGTLWTCAILAGVLHGLAVHTKLYPIIYTISFMAFFSFQERPFVSMDTSTQRTRLGQCFVFVQTWTLRLFLRFSSLLFLFSSMGTFCFLTMKSMDQYGIVALQEGLLYHFSRIDHRHNYSIYWYWFYLSKARLAHHVLLPPKYPLFQGFLTHGKTLVLTLPQIALIVVSSLNIAPYDLSLALFVQTFLFVAQNKVITAQYFTWYLCLLPLCSHRIQGDGHLSQAYRWSSMTVACVGLIVSMIHWLCVAFYVEMMGKSLHLYLWIASMIFYLAQLRLGTVILRSYRCAKTKSTETKFK